MILVASWVGCHFSPDLGHVNRCGFAGSNGGIVGADSIPPSSIFGIIKGVRGGDEPTNVELELERLLESYFGETID